MQSHDGDTLNIHQLASSRERNVVVEETISNSNSQVSKGYPRELTLLTSIVFWMLFELFWLSPHIVLYIYYQTKQHHDENSLTWIIIFAFFATNFVDRNFSNSAITWRIVDRAEMGALTCGTQRGFIPISAICIHAKNKIKGS